MPFDYDEISFLVKLFNRMNYELQQLAITEYQSNMETFLTHFSRSQIQDRFTLILLGIFVTVFGILSIRSINRVLNRTNTLISASQSFNTRSVIDLDFPTIGFSELDALAESFNLMRKDIYLYINELEEKSKLEIELQKEHLENEEKNRRLKQAQLELLRSQINPHFLFNTLNIIGKTSVLQNPALSMEIIEAISLILRYTLEHADDFVTLEEELEITRAYLFIQQTRFSKRLTYSVDIEPDTGSIRIPPVLLQPLIENSIKFGIQSTNDHLKIQVSVSSKSEGTVIVVMDNGDFPAESGKMPVPGLGIGLQNLKKRLELRYGRRDLIHQRRLPQRGIEVRILIPAVSEEIS